jgi:microcystin-dependent protein
MEAMMAEIRLFAGPYAPNGWHLCDGTLLLISKNRQLFDLIGNRYGGDGVSTFALPDLRGRTVVGASHPGWESGGYETGASFGQETVALSYDSMPAHDHPIKFDSDDRPFQAHATLYGSSNSGGQSSPEGNFLGLDDTGSSVAPYASGGVQVPMHTESVRFTNVQVAAPAVSVEVLGGQQRHPNMMPSFVLNYIICLNGIYPSPN